MPTLFQYQQQLVDKVLAMDTTTILVIPDLGKQHSVIKRIKARVKQHNEYFRQVSHRRKSCPTCKAPTTAIFSWGEYVHGKWRTVTHFCEHCFEAEVKQRLDNHKDNCGCNVNLVGYHCTLPNWLTINK